MLLKNTFWKISLSLIFLLCFSSFIEAQILEKKIAVYFPTAGDVLNKEAKNELADLAKNLNTQLDYGLEIAAHTDARGTESYNQDLAERRAQSVRDYLAELGITTDQVIVRNYGESQANADGDQIVMQKQRRVDVLIEAYEWSSLDDMLLQLQADLWTNHTIDPNQDQIIKGADGGRFFLEAHSRVDAQGNLVKEPVNIKLVECYSLEKMLLMQLSTSAQGRILETGGMFAITAETLEGQELSLAPGKGIASRIPTQSFRDDMTIFYAEGDPNEGPQDWTNSGQSVKSNFKSLLKIADPPDYPEYQALSYNGDWRNQLDEPKPPRKPRIIKGTKPEKPQKATKRYKPSGISKLFVGQKKVAKKEAALYQEAVEEYQRKKEIYKKRQANNEHKNLQYERDLEKYAEDYASWKQRNKDRHQAQYETPEALARQAEYDSLFQSKLAQYKKDMEIWEGYREQKIKRYEDALMASGEIDDEQLNYYFLNVQKLGWVNCDVFSRIANDGEFAELRAIDNNKTDEAKVLMVFKERPSILNFQARGEGEYMVNVPGKVAVDILAYKVVDGQVMLAKQAFNTGKTHELALNFEKIRLRELRETLRSLEEG